MSKFVQDFSMAYLKPQYKLVDGHIIEVGVINLQELYNSMLPNSLDSILKAFLEPSSISVSDDCVSENPYQSFEDLVESVNEFAESNCLQNLSFSEILNIMISPKDNSAKVDTSEVVSDSSDCGGVSNV